MFHKKALVFIAGIALTACQEGPPEAPNDSQVSNFRIDEFKPGADNPAWEDVQIIMDRSAPTSSKLERTFARSAFNSGRFEDVTLKIEYGSYTVNLLYTDKAKTLQYQACAAEKTKIHEINQPKFEVKIKVCRIDKNGKPEKPVGDVTLAPSADVSITPSLYDPANPDQLIDANKPGSTPSNGNPFVGMSLFVNPSYASQVASSVKLEPNMASKMQKLQAISTAIWIDRIAKISVIEPSLIQAQALQKQSGKNVLMTFVIYNLPERDCAAYASAGELSAANNGLSLYKTQYIDAIAKVFAKFPSIKIAAIVEPDSLPNMATNMSVPKCTTAAPIYKEGVAYAIQKLSQSHVSLYLDAAHGGWLGWPDNRRKMALIFKEVLDAAGGSHKIRGFATNVSNYSALSITGTDPNPDAFYENNPARDELGFTKLLGADLAAAGIKNRAFVIDTSRNGKIQSRKVRGNWCNVKAAGIGERPQVNPSQDIDAYIWVKPPGESDGTSNSSASRYDTKCSSDDSFQPAPEAGEWFHEQFKALVTNASPAL